MAQQALDRASTSIGMDERAHPSRRCSGEAPGARPRLEICACPWNSGGAERAVGAS